MSIIDAMFGKKINKMTTDDLKDHLFDVNGMLTSTRRKIDRLEQEIEKKLVEAENVQGSRMAIFAQELAAIENEIEFDGLVFSMYQQEKMNVKELIQIKEAQDTMGKVVILSGDPKMKGMIKSLMDNREMMRAKIRGLEKTREQIQRGRVSNNMIDENPQMAKFVDLINQMQNAKAKGLEKDAGTKIQEIRQAAKQMYGQRTYDNE